MALSKRRRPYCIFPGTGDDTLVLAFDVTLAGGINSASGIGIKVFFTPILSERSCVFVPDGLKVVAEDDARLDPGVAVGAVHQLANVFGQLTFSSV